MKARRPVTGQGQVYWEDLDEGEVVTGPGVTITEAHLVNWAGLTGDWVSLHLNEEYAATTQFGRRIGHGPLTLALGLGLLTQTGIFGNVRAWLGVDKVRATAPVFIGDTVHPEAVLTTSRPTKRTDQGIWTFNYTVLNQSDAPVMTFTSSLILARRQASPETDGTDG
jgi:itaconyl-CoA hydratase